MAVIPLKGAKAGREIAKPHEVTPQEVKALASYERKKSARPPLPRIKIAMGKKDDGTSEACLTVDHADALTGYKLLQEATGCESRAFFEGTLDAAGAISRTINAIDESKMNYALAFVAGLHPQDQVETTLGVQMAAIHFATVKAAENFAGARTVEVLDMQERALNRLARTFAAQVEALKRYRSKGEQRVIVERVTVHEGGQAIVGNVASGGAGEEAKNVR
ncbi:hypothetical protein SAMN04488498_113106 [Mesorhizobium albiziae]|uniref:Uncharacterized protein n=1 Tax=Neomesorhizobium albiziae TaxID=335020 RepID=A0A1I4CJA2_9HYPH|nr:hypothetical protein [Mesorhizobium albiziae]GLS29304.1 hypothetical protein GCM10007937_10120 [Mesorhizobium albiziae]SFK81318.1 hypothetical protein SAMN04488498_113106 [Mesorhizobium albiziae]